MITKDELLDKLKYYRLDGDETEKMKFIINNMICFDDEELFIETYPEFDKWLRRIYDLRRFRTQDDL